MEKKRIEKQKEGVRANLLAEATVKAEALRVSSEADLYAQQQRAEGIRAIGQAEADVITHSLMAAAKDNNVEVIKFDLALNGDLFQKMAKANAQAI